MEGYEKSAVSENEPTVAFPSVAPARTSDEKLDAAQRLLAFRLAEQVLVGGRSLREPWVPAETTRPFDTVFGIIYGHTANLRMETIATANMLLNDGLEGSCEDLLHSALLLS